MMCRSCGKSFEGDWRKTKASTECVFCSFACSHSRPQAEETNRRRSESSKRSAQTLSHDAVQRRLERLLDPVVQARIRETKRKKRYSERLRIEEGIKSGSIEYESLSERDRRKYILREQNQKCALCGNTDWLDRAIPLELHHRDGDRSNNSRSNLELLCPNCHSLTDNYKVKNKKKEVSDEDLLAFRGYSRSAFNV